jgi:hydroxymethylglutaryl-CoA reductase
MATGNDFRAIEAGGHSYAVRDGRYKSLTHIEINDSHFTYSLRIPLSLGVVGGLTNVHPLVKLSLSILGKPSAKELMEIVAAVGLANNFSAIRALITSGIQRGHMKLHLNNIINSLTSNEFERGEAQVYFKNKAVSFNAVSSFVNALRNK